MGRDIMYFNKNLLYFRRYLLLHTFSKNGGTRLYCKASKFLPDS